MSTAIKYKYKNQYVTLEEITPEIATYYLKQNSNNRPVKQNILKLLITEMPNWKVNGDPIRFSVSGRLLDGQHRLMACAEAGVAFWTYVIRGLEESVFDTLDQGAKRTPRDIVFISGEKCANDLARTLTLIWKLQNDALGNLRYPTNRQRIEVLQAYPQVRDSVAYGCALNVNKIIPHSLVAFLHFMGTAIDEPKTISFLEALGSFANLPENSPVLVFIKTAMELKHARKKPSNRSDFLIALAIKAMQAHYEYRLITRYLHYKKNEKFPVLTKPAHEMFDQEKQ